MKKITIKKLLENLDGYGIVVTEDIKTLTKELKQMGISLNTEIITEQ